MESDFLWSKLRTLLISSLKKNPSLNLYRLIIPFHVIFLTIFFSGVQEIMLKKKNDASSNNIRFTYFKKKKYNNGNLGQLKYVIDVDTVTQDN